MLLACVISKEGAAVTSSITPSEWAARSTDSGFAYRPSPDRQRLQHSITNVFRCEPTSQPRQLSHLHHRRLSRSIVQPTSSSPDDVVLEDWPAAFDVRAAQRHHTATAVWRLLGFSVRRTGPADVSALHRRECMTARPTTTSPQPSAPRSAARSAGFPGATRRHRSRLDEE